MQKPKLIYFSIFFLLSIFFCLGCEDIETDVVPYVYTDVSINIDTDAEFFSLQTTSNSLKLETHPEGKSSIGYDDNGIIIYHMNYRTLFYAFDATCPNDLPESVSLVVEGSMATCPVCESVYILPSEGIPADGSVSRYYLKSYRTAFYSSGDLKIYN